MIQSSTLIEELKSNGLTFGSGVPCSILKPLLCEILVDCKLDYYGAANEAQAIAISTGAEIAGRPSFVLMQNSGLCNAIEPLSSLNDVFDTPLLLIISWRGQPQNEDASHHGLAGTMLPDILSLLGIPWEILPSDEKSAVKTINNVVQVIKTQGRSSALIICADTLAPAVAEVSLAPKKRRGRIKVGPVNETKKPRRIDVLKQISGLRDQRDFIFSTTGKSSRELYLIGDHNRNLYLVGSMGLVASVALGVSLVRSERMVVIDGDGSLLMHLGAMATIGAFSESNFLHIVLDNGVHDSTGGQPTVSPNINFPEIAIASGYSFATSTNSFAGLAQCWSEAINSSGPSFIHVEIEPGSVDPLPRPSFTPAQNLSRFRQSFHADCNAAVNHLNE